MRTRLELEQIRNARIYDDTMLVASGWAGDGTIVGDVNAIISQIKNVTGETNWYDAPQATLAELAAVSGVSNHIGYKHKEAYHIPSTLSSGTEVVIPNGATYTQDADGRNLDVSVNGQVQMFGPGEDYIESSTSGVKFTFRLTNRDKVEFRVLS
jgi:hypothetical protein